MHVNISCIPVPLILYVCVQLMSSLTSTAPSLCKWPWGTQEGEAECNQFGLGTSEQAARKRLLLHFLDNACSVLSRLPINLCML